MLCFEVVGVCRKKKQHPQRGGCCERVVLWICFVKLVFSSLIKAGIDGVEILAVKLILRDADRIGETIRVKYFNQIVFPIICV